MPDAIPLVYLYRIEAVEWLPRLFNHIWVPTAVVEELREGQRRGFDCPDPHNYGWLESQGLTEKVEPLIRRLSEQGMWLSDEIRVRILALAGETPPRL